MPDKLCSWADYENPEISLCRGVLVGLQRWRSAVGRREHRPPRRDRCSTNGGGRPLLDTWTTPIATMLRGNVHPMARAQFDRERWPTRNQ